MRQHDVAPGLAPAFARTAFALDPAACAALADDEIVDQLLPLVRSNRFSFDRENATLLLNGPDTPYHGLDPHLKHGLDFCGFFGDLGDVRSFHRFGEDFDLCFEDSWCGLFLATYLSGLQPSEALTIVHLDDHSDMMSTLLTAKSLPPSASLFDPVIQRPFAPDIPDHWPYVIESGAVGIGSFLTPFFALSRQVHVRHLKAASGSSQHFTVTPAALAHPLFKDMAFLDLALCKEAAESGSQHTYRIGERVEEVLHELPSGKLVIHIDLDYFINDFNGNDRDGDYTPSPRLHFEALERLDAFFVGLGSVAERVERWMIATSPGFCSAVHWPFLLEELERRIRLTKATA